MVESLRTEVVVEDDRLDELLPGRDPVPFREAVRLALRRGEGPGSPWPEDPAWAGGR